MFKHRARWRPLMKKEQKRTYVFSISLPIFAKLREWHITIDSGFPI